MADLLNPTAPAPAAPAPVTTNLVPGNYGAPPLPTAQPATPAPIAPLGGAPAGPGQVAPAAAPAPAGGYQPAPAAPAAPVAPATPEQFLQMRQDLARAQAQLQQVQPYVQLGQQAAAQRLTQPTSPASPQTPANPFGVPTFDMKLKSYIGVNEQGQTYEKPGAPPGTLYAYEQYMAAAPDALNRIVGDPRGTLGPIFKEMIAEEAGKIADQKFSAYKSEQRVNAIVAEISPWAIAKDATGAVVMEFDPMTGGSQPKLTPLGEHYANASKYIHQSGVTDPEAIHRYATNAVNMAKAQMPAAPTMPVTQTVAQQLQQQPYPAAPSQLQAPANTHVPTGLPRSPTAFPSGKQLMRHNAAVMGVIPQA